MIAPNKARPIGRAFFAYSGIDFAALRGDARCCLPREWSHFKAICAAGEPEGQGPPRMRSCIAFGNAFSSRSEWRTIPRASEPQGSPRGQGPPRMRSLHRRQADEVEAFWFPPVPHVSRLHTMKKQQQPHRRSPAWLLLFACACTSAADADPDAAKWKREHKRGIRNIICKNDVY